MKDKVLYGLFLYTYDHHEWESLYYVSFDVEKLKGETSYLYATTEEDHEMYADDETNHFFIKPVDVV